MSKLSEIIDLFAGLAVHLQSPNPVASEEESIHESILKLNRSLNFNHEKGSRARVLDAALSLMCFKAPQVFDTTVEVLVRTIVSVLSSSTVCKVVKIREPEVLQIGCSIRLADCFKLIDACPDLIEGLVQRGIPSSDLVWAIMKAALSSSCLQYSPSFSLILDTKPFDGRTRKVSRLLHLLPEVICPVDQGIQLRLLAWYLDPSTLNCDILKIIQEVKDRPLLCLSEELHQRMEWRLIMTCLALSPIMFIETRALLHHWLLSLGLASVLQFQCHLVSTIVDIASRPTWWGLSVDVGSKLPFLHAYFPCNHGLLRTLAGPVSPATFLHLVHILNEAAMCRKIPWKHAGMHGAIIGHQSTWAMAMNFPLWFLFACSLLFSDSNTSQYFSTSAPQTTNGGLSYSHAVAESYISWILCPISVTDQDKLIDYLKTMSRSWIKRFSIERPDREREHHKKRLKRLSVNEKDNTFVLKEHHCQWIRDWLEECQDSITKPGSFCCRSSLLFRKIPLGILLAYADLLNEGECETLLHYAATGRILHSRASPVGMHSKNCKTSDREDAIAGACLVFDFTDTVESMLYSLFESEEHAQDFISLVKRNASRYLLQCIMTLLEVKMEDTSVIQLLKDLQCRIERWRRQGQDPPVENKDFDGVMTLLGQKLLCST